MSTATLYAARLTDQTLAVGDSIFFDQTVRRFGKNARLYGGNIITSGAGYYRADVNIVLTDSAAGVVKFTLLQDGVAVPGAEAESTTGTASAVRTLNITGAILKNTCCKDTVLSIELTGAAAVVNNATITIEKI